MSESDNQQYFLDLGPTSEIDTLWFVSFPDEGRDMFAAVYRDAPDRPWTGMVRFRHPDGEKSGTYIRPSAEMDVESFRRRMVNTFDTSFLMAPTPDEFKHRLEVKGDVWKLHEAMKQVPWMEQHYEGTELLALTHEWPTRES